MKSIFIAGKQVNLRKITEKDLKGPYVEWFNDPIVTRGTSHGRFPQTLQKTKHYLDQVSKSDDKIVLAIALSKSDKHIGNISLQNIHWLNRSADLAIIMGDRASWGKGYSKEAAQLLLSHGFDELNLNRIACGTFKTNLGMIGLAKSLKMKQESIKKEAAFKNGKYVDIIEFAILRRDYIKTTR